MDKALQFLEKEFTVIVPAPTFVGWDQDTPKTLAGPLKTTVVAVDVMFFVFISTGYVLIFSP